VIVIALTRLRRHAPLVFPADTLFLMATRL
jgi:hypothetical protein